MIFTEIFKFICLSIKIPRAIMETKTWRNCFLMKEKIIELSISGLQKHGLRFSIDEIAKSLRISKKTIYKYFPGKEDLASAVYEKFYSDTNSLLDDLLAPGTAAKFSELLAIYYRSYCMIKKEIFNKYALNDAIRTVAASAHERVWQRIQSKLPEDERDIVKNIIDGTFEKFDKQQASIDKTLTILERLI